MLEVTMNINYKGKHYLTNVIVQKDTSKIQILKLAQEQVKKQW
ncbi:BA3454 family stress response protein [Gottfriedia sp. NPDC058432]